MAVTPEQMAAAVQPDAGRTSNTGADRPCTVALTSSWSLPATNTEINCPGATATGGYRYPMPVIGFADEFCPKAAGNKATRKIINKTTHRITLRPSTLHFPDTSIGRRSGRKCKRKTICSDRARPASTRKSAEHFSAIGNVRRTARSIFDMPKPVIAFRPRSPGPSIATNAAGFRHRPPGACRSAIQTGARQVHGGSAAEHGEGKAGARVEQTVQCQPRGRSTENAAASEWRTSKSDEPASVAENAADGAQKTSASAELLSMECSQL